MAELRATPPSDGGETDLRRPSGVSVRAAAARAAAILTVPTAAVFLGLVAAGELSPWHGLGGVAVTAAASFLLVRRHHADLAVLRRHLDDRAGADDPRSAIAERRSALAGIGEVGTA